MIRKTFSLLNSADEIIRAEIHYRVSVRDAPVIVICHGFKGFKNWAFFPVIAETLALADYIALTFNFSRNGVGADLNNFTELDLFAKNTYSHELDDLRCVIDAIVERKIGKGLIDPERIGLLGHSRGGGVAILHASLDERIKSLVTWSAISTVERYSEEEIALWEKMGYLEFENKRTGQLMRVNKDLLDDIRANKDSLSILSAAGKLDIPTLIIHGQDDDSVPVVEAEKIYEHLKAPHKELMLIEEGNHTFNAQHPLQSMPPQLETVFDLTENWFDRFLI
jgi:dienelactone hydrolase